MEFNFGNQSKRLAFICAILLSISASAQPFVRYVVPSDLGTKTLFSNTVLSSVTLPQGVSRVDNNPFVRDAAFELMDILRDKNTKLLCVYVCGSASPDGLWQENVNLSKARTSAAANYLHHVTGIPMELIHQESLNEDWDRLYELVEASDIRCKEQVLDIITTKEWGERKRALQTLDGGKVWRILLDDFFPQLRCVRIGFFCLWDPSKPYLECPAEKAPAEEPAPKADTVYVRDTVYYVKETVQIYNDEAYGNYREENRKKGRKEKPAKEPKVSKYNGPYYATPWMMGVKTNLLADALVVPDLGLEIQLGKKLSLDINGWYTNTNIFCKSDYTSIYGVSPELRWWFGRNTTMQKGHFVGLHANFAWYTLEWKKKDGTHVLYQNGKEGDYSQLDAGSKSPAWSFGVTYGYSLALDRKAHWGLEFVVGLGYIKSLQNVGIWMDTPNPAWYFTGNESRNYFGVTQLGINLTYRFSLRKVSPDYYSNR